MLAALKSARRHLEPGALAILDFWYGPAVLRQRPPERVKLIPGENGDVLRAASGELDSGRHTCAVRYRMWHLSDRRLLAETDETHQMRYFFPQELSLFLDCSVFSLVRLGAFPDIDRPADEETWNALVVARAV